MPDSRAHREDKFWHVVLASVVILSLLFPDNPVFNVAGNVLQALQDQPPVVVVPLFTALFVVTHSLGRIRSLAVHHGFMGAHTEITNSHQSTLANSVPPLHHSHQKPSHEPSPQAKSHPHHDPQVSSPQPESKPSIVKEPHHPIVGAMCKAVLKNEAGGHEHFPQVHHVGHSQAVLPPPEMLSSPERERRYSPPRHMGPHQGEFPTRGTPVYRYPPGTEASKKARQPHYIEGLNDCNWVPHEHHHVKKSHGKFFTLSAKDIPRAQISTDFATNATKAATGGGRRWLDIFNQLYS